jgi:signal transduction histidine kinase
MPLNSFLIVVLTDCQWHHFGYDLQIEWGINRMAQPHGSTDGARLTQGPVLDSRAKVIARELRSQLQTDLAGLAGLFGVTAWCWHAFQGHAPRKLLLPWTAIMSSLLVIWALMLVQQWRSPPSDEDVMGFWLDWHLAGSVCLNAAIAISVWVFMPFAPADLFAPQLLLYAWYVLSFCMIATASVRSAMWTLHAVPLSLALWLFTSGTAGGAVSALVVLLMSGSAALLQTLVRRATLAAEEAQVRAEETNLALQRAMSEVIAQRDARSQLLAAVSHDLQQPVQAASMLFDLACDSPAKVSADIATTGRAAFASVQSLLQEMLHFMRLTSSGLRMRPRHFELAELLERIAAPYHFRFGARTRLSVHVRPQTVRSDPELLERAITNLLENALRHANARRVMIIARQAEERVRIWVVDDGRGMDDARAALAFEPFANAGQAGEVTGFGLGLPSARLIARELGGDLALDRRVRKGCSFLLELPALPPLPQGSGAVTPAEPAAWEAA